MSSITLSKNAGCNIEMSKIVKSKYFEQYPVETKTILSGDIAKEGKACLSIGEPFKGYKIEAEYKNGVMNGKVLIFDEKHLLIADLNVVNGVREGECKEYDSEGNCLFSGMYHNDKKKGVCQPYSGKEGEMIRYTDDDKSFAYKKLRDTFYEETDMTTKQKTAITEVNTDFERHGKCYCFDEKGVPGYFIYDTGEPVQCYKTFTETEMTQYDDNNNVIYKGGYDNIFDNDYCAKGKGQLFGKENEIIYIGEFDHGKKNGQGKFFVDGRKRYEGNWVNDYPSGAGKYYDENGTVKADGMWTVGYFNVAGNEWLDYETGEKEKVNNVSLLKKYKERGGVVVVNNNDDDCCLVCGPIICFLFCIFGFIVMGITL